MNTHIRWSTAALAGALLAAAQFESLSATTNGVILISTRKNQDTAISQEYINEEKGPGQATPGDVAMAALFGDHGYSCRLVLDVMLGSPPGTHRSELAEAGVIPLAPQIAATGTPAATNSFAVDRTGSVLASLHESAPGRISIAL